MVAQNQHAGQRFSLAYTNQKGLAQKTEWANPQLMTFQSAKAIPWRVAPQQSSLTLHLGLTISDLNNLIKC